MYPIYFGLLDVSVLRQRCEKNEHLHNARIKVVENSKGRQELDALVGSYLCAAEE